MPLLDRCIFNSATQGTADFVVASPVTGFMTPAQANAVDGTQYHYAAQIVSTAGIGQWEVGSGTYTAATTTLSRTSILFSSSSNTKVNFTTTPQVMFSALAEDLPNIAAGKALTVNNTLTFTGTDNSSVAFGAGGSVLYGNQTVTLTGDVTGSGATSIATTLATGNAGNLNSGTLLAARMPALTGDVTSTVNTTATTLAAGNAGNLNSGTLLAARMPALTGDVTSTVNTTATTIANNAVTNAKAAQATANTLKGNPTSSTANVTDTQQPVLGTNGGTGGQITFNGATSGSCAARVAAAAGTSTIFQFPATNGVLGQGLSTDGSGNASWQKTNFVWVDRNNVNQTGIVNNTSTKLALNHKAVDVDGVFDAVTNFRYTPNVAGTFLVCGAVTMVPSSTTFEVGVNIFKNGSTLFISMDMSLNTALNLVSFSAPFAALVQMNGTTDFIELFVFISNSGGATNSVAGAVPDTFLTAQRIGP